MKRVEPSIESHKRGKNSYAPLQRVRGSFLLMIWSIHMNSIPFTLRAQSFSEIPACTDLFLHFSGFLCFLIIFFADSFLTKLDLQSISQALSVGPSFLPKSKGFIAIIQMGKSFFFFFKAPHSRPCFILDSFYSHPEKTIYKGIS